jgi:hypothetical protein
VIPQSGSRNCQYARAPVAVAAAVGGLVVEGGTELSKGRSSLFQCLAGPAGRVHRPAMV